MTRLPAFIHIGGIRYSVDRFSDPLNLGAPMGRFMAREARMLVLDDLAPEVARSTLLHECLEAVNYSNQLDLPHPTIMVLEAALDALLRANPELLALYLPETADV